MTKEFDNIGIETIDVGTPEEQTNGFDLMAEIMAEQAVICEIMSNIMDNVTETLRNQANIQHVTFLMTELPHELAQKMIANPQSELRPFTVAGEDNEYYYSIFITPEINEDNSIAAVSHLYRTEKTNKLNKKGWMFNFEENTWMELNITEYMGCTKEMANFVDKNPGHPCSELIQISRFRHWQQALDNEKMKLFFCKNKEILDLYLMQDEPEIFDFSNTFLDDNQLMIIPLPKDIDNGLAVVYKDKKYQMYTAANGELIDMVYETADKDEMFDKLDGLLNRKLAIDIIALVPLSETGAMEIYPNGDCIHISCGEDNAPTKEEERVLKHFFQVCADHVNEKEKRNN